MQRYRVTAHVGSARSRSHYRQGRAITSWTALSPPNFAFTIRKLSFKHPRVVMCTPSAHKLCARAHVFMPPSRETDDAPPLEARHLQPLRQAFFNHLDFPTIICLCFALFSASKQRWSFTYSDSQGMRGSTCALTSAQPIPEQRSFSVLFSTLAAFI